MHPSTTPPAWPPPSSTPPSTTLPRRRRWPWIVIPCLSVALVIIASVLIAAALPRSGASDPMQATNGQGGAPLARGEMPHVWVGGTSDDVYMIQVARQGTSLSGTYDATWLATTTEPNSVHAAFSGVIDGTAITLIFPQGLGFVSNIA